MKKKKGLILLLLCVIVVLPCFYIANIYKEVSAKLSLPAVSTASKDQSVMIDRESLLDSKVFNLFMKFNTKRIVDILPIKLNKREQYFDANQKLGGLLRNDCARQYCYQHKTSFENIPLTFLITLMSTEDTRFLDHSGVDPKAIARAAVVDIVSMSFKQGGSTLTQQLVKNLILTKDKKLVRKIKEALYALVLEKKYSKEEIIQTYLNEVFWGSISGIRIKGYRSASLFYFGKKSTELSFYEVTVLIALLKGPYYYSPFNHLDRLKERVKAIYKKISKFDPSHKWSDKDWENWQKKLKDNNRSIILKALTNASKMKLNNLNQYQATQINYEILKKLKYLEKIRGKKDYAIKVIAGDLNCIDCKKDYLYSKVERDSTRAIEVEKHPLGSLIKPFIYSVYQEGGNSLSEMISTSPVTLKLVSGDWTPRESSKHRVGDIAIIDGLRKSKNIPTIKIALDYGLPEMEEKLLSYFPNLQRPLKEYPAQLLGSYEMSLSEMYKVYQHFLLEECRKEKNIVSQMLDPRTTTISRVVMPRLKDRNFFGKTGTTNNAFDNLFIYSNGSLLSIVWVGIENRQNEKNLRLSGATTAFDTLQRSLLYWGKRLEDFECGGQVYKD